MSCLITFRLTFHLGTSCQPLQRGRWVPGLLQLSAGKAASPAKVVRPNLSALKLSSECCGAESILPPQLQLHPIFKNESVLPGREEQAQGSCPSHKAGSSRAGFPQNHD